MKWRIASASARGSSHVRSGRPNQDACEHGTGEPGGALKSILAVSDGHGGGRHFRSEIGSRLAAHIAIAVIQESLPPKLSPEPEADLPDEAIPLLTQKIVEDWRTAVLSDLGQHPFTSEELEKLEASDGSDARVSVEQDPVLAYGATLLTVVAARTFMLYLQLGDGDILAVDVSGNTSRPLPADDRLIGNQTTSLCQAEAWREFRTAVERSPNEFAAVVLASTDGYANSFRSEEDFLKIGHDYLKLVREHGLDSLSEELPHILSEASEKGSGDDITLSVLVSDAAYATPPAVDKTQVDSSVETIKPGKTPPANFQAAKAPVNPAVASSAAQKVSPASDAIEPAAPDLLHRFSSSQIRLILLVLAVLAGAFAVQHYARRPKKTEASRGTPSSSPITTPAKKIGNAPPEGKTWMLKLSGGPPIWLQAGTTITAKQLIGVSQGDYAEVRQEDGFLRLMNLSEDPWAVTRPDKKVEPPLEKGAGVVLGNGIKITFGHGKIATIALADLPEDH